MLRFFAIAFVLVHAGCNQCFDNPDRCPTTQESICTQLLDCGVIVEAEYTDCVRAQTGTEGPRDPDMCLMCLDMSECDMVAIDACNADQCS